MFSRVVLLISATLLFAAVWNCQESGSRRSLASRPPTAAQSAREAERLLKVAPWAEAAIAAAASPAQEPQVSTAVAADEPIPFPPGIAAGTYVVVDRRGTTSRLTIVDEDLAGPSTPEDHYLVTTETGRWHYIRIDAVTRGAGVATGNPQSDVAEPEATSFSEAALQPFPAADTEEAEPTSLIAHDRRLNRKFDFRGYIEQPTLSESPAAPAVAWSKLAAELQNRLAVWFERTATTTFSANGTIR